MTLISHKHKFIFLANQKCGSTTLEAMLKPYACEAFTKGIRAKPVGRHDSAVKVKRYLASKGLKLDDYFVITTIRNPFTRIPSCYAFERHKKMKSAQCPFEIYVQNRRYKHFTDIKDFTHDNDQSLVDHIIRLERFRDGIPRLFHRLHLPRARTIPTRNSSQSKPFGNLWTKKLRRIVFDRHANDFAFYQP